MEEEEELKVMEEEEEVKEEVEEAIGSTPVAGGK